MRAHYRIDLPGVDELTDRYAVHRSRRRKVDFSAAIGQFLLVTQAENVVPILITGTDARVGMQLNMELIRNGGVWLVERPDGTLVDALRGVAVRDCAAAADRFEAEARAEHLLPEPDLDTGTGALGFELMVHHRATEELRIGRLAETLLEVVVGDRPDCWGSTQPLNRTWDREALTRAAREFMPASAPLRGSAPGGAQFVLHYERTTSGVTERLRGAVPLGRYADVVDRSVELSAALFERIERDFVVVAGMTTLLDTEADLSFAARGRRAEVPRALQIGPWAIKEGSVNPARMVAQFGARQLGRAVVPSLLFTFPTGAGQLPPWQQLHDVYAAIGFDNVAHALGWDPR